ncbi:hypothetical protein RFI_20901, partial [Reticulomyxa filosa]
MEAVRRCCTIHKYRNTTKITSNDVLDKCRKHLQLELKSSGTWESQDPRSGIWMAYDHENVLRIEQLYKNFAQQAVTNDLLNLDELHHVVDVFIESRRFTVDIRHGVQMNNSGGNRPVRRRKSAPKTSVANDPVSQEDTTVATSSATGNSNPISLSMSSTTFTVSTRTHINPATNVSMAGFLKPLQKIMDSIVTVMTSMDEAVDSYLAQTKAEKKDNEASEEKTLSDSKKDDNAINKNEPNKEKDKLLSKDHLIGLMTSHQLFTPDDMLNVVKNVVYMYPSLSKFVVSHISGGKSFIQFVVDRCLPYSTNATASKKQSESRSMMTNRSTTLAMELLSTLIHSGSSKSPIDKETLKKIVILLVAHVESLTKYLTSDHKEQERVFPMACSIVADLEVLESFIKNAQEKPSRFAAQLMLENSLIQSLCKLLDGKVM